MDGLLAGQRVLVVGGSAGIGLAVAKAAHASGAAVVVVGRDATQLEGARAEIGAVATHVADAGDETSLERLFDAVDRFDHLVTTVHESSSLLGADRTMAEIGLAAAQRYMGAKFWAQYSVAKCGLRRLSDRGSITFTSGIASRRTLPRHSVIGATNAAIEAAARQLAREIAPRRVNVVSPGLTVTRTYSHMDEAARKTFFDHIAAVLPVGHIGRAEDVAVAYLFAMSCAYLSGVVIDVDGGYSII